MRIATVDVGTNTALLLVADASADGSLVPVHDEERFVRLGEGVDERRVLSSGAIGRTLHALADYASTAEQLGARLVTITGTSASRDADNLDELSERVAAEIGIRYEVLSGEEEALWSFRGTLTAFPGLDRACVFDVGGGSTEIVAGARDGLDAERLSLEIGSVRLTERVFGRIPPSADAIRAADELIAVELDRLTFGRSLPVIGSAGTVTALARLIRGTAGPQRLTATEVCDWRDRLLGLSADEVRALAPAVLSGRADVFAAGVTIVAAVLRRLEADELLVSPAGLRHGLALRWLEDTSAG